MRVHVQLPADPLIEYWSFCKSIVQAICPTGEQGLHGIDCIVGKMVKCHVPMAGPADDEKWASHKGLQSVLLSDDGRTFDQMLSDQHAVAREVVPEQLPLEDDALRSVVELSLPYLLSDDDRRALEVILPHLPPLRYPMADSDEAAFLDAYFNLPTHPAWAPILVNPGYIERRKTEQVAVLERHQRALQEEFVAGRLVAVDVHHVPVVTLVAGTLIPREHAIAYLDRCGFAHNGNGIHSDTQQKGRSVKPGPARAPAVMPPTVSDASKQKPTRAALKTTEEPSKGKVGKPHAENGRGDVSGPQQSASDQQPKVVGKVIKLPRVKELTGLGRSSIYNRMDPNSRHYDPTFPLSFPLGARPGSAVGWNEEEVKMWVVAQQSTGRAS